MTLTTEVRIAWPVPPLDLLNVATVAAGGDPATVGRTSCLGGDGCDVPYHDDTDHRTGRRSVRNIMGQGGSGDWPL